MTTFYKFRDFRGNGLRLLAERAIHFASPATLNDPLDSQLDVKSAIRAAVHRMSGEDAEIMSRILRFSAMKKGSGAKLPLHDAFTEFQSQVGIFSMSKNCTDMLLWSHYADGHKGFSIGFTDTFFSRLLKEYDKHYLIGVDVVSYQTTPEPSLDLFDEILDRIKSVRRSGTEVTEDDEDFVRTTYRRQILGHFLTVKSIAWEYEKEYRAITHGERQVEFMPNEIEAIVFGMRTAKSDEEAIRELLVGSEWKHLRYKRASTSENSFVLRLDDC